MGFKRLTRDCILWSKYLDIQATLPLYLHRRMMDSDQKIRPGYLGYPLIGYLWDVTLFGGGKKDTHNELDPLSTR